MKAAREPDVTTSGDERVAGTQAIVRTLAVLRVLREGSGEVGISDIARTLSLHTSTIHRIVRALVGAGYVVQNPLSERYSLGHEAYLLGRAAERNLGFDAVQPILERLSEETGESVNLVVRDGNEGLVVLRVESEHPLRFTQPVGTRIPLYCTSTGKALLAFSEDTQADLSDLGRLKRLTPATITSHRELRRELANIRRDEFSVNAGERMPGVCGVAAPVLNVDRIAIAAVAVQGPAVRMPDTRLAELGPLVIESAREIARVLPAGYAI